MIDSIHRVLIEPVVYLLDQGGWVLVAIALASVLAWTLIFWEWIRLSERMHGGWDSIETAICALQAGQPACRLTLPLEGKNFVGRLLQSPIINQRLDRQSFEAQVIPILKNETVMFERSMRVVVALAASMPLLGLLGTVLGMIETFGALTDHSITEVDALAGGISQALITTQAGLIIAVPVLLVHGLIRSRINNYLSTASVLLKKIEAIVVD